MGSPPVPRFGKADVDETGEANVGKWFLSGGVLLDECASQLHRLRYDRRGQRFVPRAAHKHIQLSLTPKYDKQSMESAQPWKQLQF